MNTSSAALSQVLAEDLSSLIPSDAKYGWAPDSRVAEVQAFVLRDSLLKKFNSQLDPSPSACAAALEKFRRVNDRCGSWRYEPRFEWEAEVVGEVRNLIHQFWTGIRPGRQPDEPLVSDMRQLFRRGRAGPGASIKARDSDFYTKMFDSPLAATGDLHDTWNRCIREYALWNDAEMCRALSHPDIVVDSSNYSFVNKTVTVARGICTEPAINMWFQLGVGGLIEDRLRSWWGIDMALQPDVNRVLARVGSFTGQLATIDLESASDSLGMKMLQEVLPRGMLSLLRTLRCPATRLPGPKGQTEELVLNMVSTMGNGFTFPLQTMLFTAVCIAVYRYFGVPCNLYAEPSGCDMSVKRRVRRSETIGYGHSGFRNMAVFGDDIIVETHVARYVIRVLELLGFVTNSEKTFVEGPFRESCGADFFNGVNVRGVYIKSLNTLQDHFVAINSLTRWTAKTGIPLPETCGFLCAQVGTKVRPHRTFVPLDESLDAGIHVPSEWQVPHAKTIRERKWNANQSRLPKARRKPLPPANGQLPYTADVPYSWNFVIIGDVCWTYKSQVRRALNPSGVILSALHGSFIGNVISLRQREVMYTTRRKWTPRWDYFLPSPHEDLYFPSCSRLVVSACERNLLGVRSGSGG